MIIDTGYNRHFKWLKEYKIPIPPLPIQQKIAEILEKADALIEKRKEQIAKLDLLVKSQFIEMFGDPVMNSMGWDVYPLDNLCSMIVDCPHSTPHYLSENTGYMCIRTSLLQPNCIDWKNIEYITEVQYNDRVKRYTPVVNDILYSREGAILGIAALIDKNVKIALGQRMMLLSTDKKICSHIFLCYILNSPYVINQVKSKIIGSASPRINVADVKCINILLPPLALQNRFADFVKAVDKSKFEIQQGLEKLELLYKSLMQKCFSGELF